MDRMRLQHTVDVGQIRQEIAALREELTDRSVGQSRDSSPPSRVKSGPVTLPWEMIENIVAHVDSPATLATMSRSSFDVLKICGPALYETVELWTKRQIQALFSVRSKASLSVARVLPYLSLDQIKTLHVCILPPGNRLPTLSLSRFTSNGDPGAVFPPNLRLTYNQSVSTDGYDWPHHIWPTFDTESLSLISLFNPAHIAFAYVGTPALLEEEPETWQPIDVGVIVGQAMRDRYSNVKTIHLERCVPFDTPHGYKRYFFFDGSDAVRDAVVTSDLNSPNAIWTETKALVSDLTRYRVYCRQAVGKIVVRVNDARAKTELETRFVDTRKNDPNKVLAPSEVIVLGPREGVKKARKKRRAKLQGELDLGPEG